MKIINLNFPVIFVRIFMLTISLSCSPSNAAWLVRDTDLITIARTLAKEGTLKSLRDDLNTKEGTIGKRIVDIKKTLDDTYKRNTLVAVSDLAALLKMPTTANNATTLKYSEIECPKFSELNVLTNHKLDKDIAASCENINTIAKKIFSETRDLYDKLIIIQNKLFGYKILKTTDPGQLASLAFELQTLQASQANLIGMHMATLEAYKLNLESAKHSYLKISFRKVTN